MAIQHLLEDFSTDVRSESNNTTDDDAVFLESFEQGYKAGWEDAVRATAEEQSHIATDLARNLQDLSFTYHEAHAAILAEIAPVIEQAVMAVIPDMADTGFAHQIAAEIKHLTDQTEATDVILRVAVENLDAVKDLLAPSSTLPLRIDVDETLSPGQAHLSFGNRERKIDVSEVVANVGKAFSGFVQQAKKEAQHD